MQLRLSEFLLILGNNPNTHILGLGLAIPKLTSRWLADSVRFQFSIFVRLSVGLFVCLIIQCPYLYIHLFRELDLSIEAL